MVAVVGLGVGCGDDGGTSGTFSASQASATDVSTTGGSTTGESTTDTPTSSGKTADGTTTDSPTTDPTTSDGTTTDGTTTDNTTTTGPAPICGDSNVDPGEECDDGNVVYMVRIGTYCSNSIFYVS